MPSLPSSSPSAPSFSLSPSGVVALVVVVVLALGGCAMHVVVVPFIRRKIKERRVLVADAEEAPGTPIPTAQSFISISTQSIAAAVLVAARANMTVTLEASMRPKVPTVCVAKVLANVAPRCHLKRLEEYEVSARFHTRRRHALRGPSPLRTVICAHDLKKTVAAAALVAARSKLPLTSKASVRPKVPAVCVAKVLANVAPRCHLKQLTEYEVPARFGPCRTRVLPGPSPLRSVVSAAHDAPPMSSSPTVLYDAQDAPVTAPSSPTRVLGTSQLTNLRQSARAKQPAAKASQGASKRRPARRMFTGEKENGQPFRFPPRAVAA
ncbi:hypothetical protein B0H13DRAFT_2662912 [Mycena leptocephala]|nr:hypothetical protein B0H13DRAFT_2662912 [Mycena leptocephala]